MAPPQSLLGTAVRNQAVWPGFDPAFTEAIRSPSVAGDGDALSTRLAAAISRTRGRAYQLGPPALVSDSQARRISRFAAAFHRAVETIIERYPTDPELQRVLALPRGLRADLELDRLERNGAVHLCRLDLILDEAGGFKVLETNANCPGALVFAGWAAREWRSLLTDRGVRLPRPLGHEDERWMARWFIDTSLRETGRPPEVVSLLRQEGGVRTEFTELASQFALEGVETIEADPRDIALSKSGAPSVGNRRFNHAYLKLAIPEFRRMRASLTPFVQAVGSGALFVQNGLPGRWIGDNKLCLAVLSDPLLRDRFPADDWDLIRQHLPWSRNIAMCTKRELRQIRECPWDFVLKRPLDTRGRGVVIGRECGDRSRWNTLVDRAVRGGWLVQRFCTATEIEEELSTDRTAPHDLAVALVNGQLAGAFIRSSHEAKMNIAFSGRLHPVFFGDSSPGLGSG